MYTCVPVRVRVFERVCHPNEDWADQKSRPVAVLSWRVIIVTSLLEKVSLNSKVKTHVAL